MQIGIIGDIHGSWDRWDTAFFNACGYDALLFVGDFARIVGSLPVARLLSGLNTPAWAIAGNHDAVSLLQLLAELKNRVLLRRLTSLRMSRRVRAVVAGHMHHQSKHTGGWRQT